MKKLLLLLCLLQMMMSSCKEETSGQQSFEDAQIIDLYVRSYQLEGSYISNGIFKSVIQPGSGGQTPHRKQGVVVNYSLQLANKTEISFGKNLLIQQGIGSFFEGFEMATASMVKGEKSFFFIPSDIAFGNKSYSVNGRKIPSSAVIILEIELLDIVDEDAIMKYYFASNGISPEKTESGIYYNIDTLNSSNISPDINDIVTIEYSNYYLCDTLISDDQSISFIINEQQDWDDTGIINGLEEAVLLMKEGDQGIFVFPSALAYGNDGNLSIPPDAILVYKVKLTKVKK